MPEEVVREVEMMYIQNTSADNYSIETHGRRAVPMKLNFTHVDGVEIDAKKPMEIKNSYLQMADGQTKMWNLRFHYPTNFKIKYMGKIVIEVI